jgi:hypothetical protein
MDDIERRNSYPSTADLAKQGLRAIAYATGGIFLFVLQSVSRFRVLGLIVGGVVCVAGIISLLAKDPADKKAGGVICGAGLLVVLSKSGIPLMKVAASTLLGIGAIALFVLGVLNGFRFFRGLRKRS